MRIPKLRRNGDGRAFTEYKTKRTYFGKFGDPAAEAKYRVWLSQIISGDHIAIPATNHNHTVAKLIDLYMAWVEGNYDKPTAYNIGWCLDFLLDAAGDYKGKDIRPSWLIAIQEKMIEDGRYRKVINEVTSRIKHMVRWCCVNDYLPDNRYHALLAVENLKMGHPRAKEGEPIEPVDYVHVLAVKPFLPPHLWVMIELQRMCGMRPQDVVRIKPKHIDRSGPIWLYKPPKHKTSKKGKMLVKGIPVAAQELLAPFLDRDPDAHCFSPIEVQAWRQEHTPQWAGHERKTPLYPSEIRRREKNKAKPKPKPHPRSINKNDHYATSSYRRAIVYAFERAEEAGVKFERWHPNQLRHSIGTEVSQTLGQQAGQRWLGHSQLSTTAIYAKIEEKEIIAIAEQLDSLWQKPPAASSDPPPQ